MRPKRLVLSRRAGFKLQEASRALNGPPGYSVARPGPWGNPFSIDAVAVDTGMDRLAAQAEAVDRHRRWLLGELAADRPAPSLAEIRSTLSGKNLGCWCAAGTPCHAETLIALAND